MDDSISINIAPLKLAIVGRPNVGKSTLFNKLARKQLAIVDDTPGVTRDWRMADADFYDLPVTLIDTAGLEDAETGSIEERMRAQTEQAIDQADIILFVIDGRAGVTPIDSHFASLLRKRNAPVILGINKCEGINIERAASADAFKLGLGEPVCFSAEHGLGFDDLYDALNLHVENAKDEKAADIERKRDEEQTDEIIQPHRDEDIEKLFPDLDDIEGADDFEFQDPDELKDESERPIKMSIVGRPNAGKSTLVNAMLGENRVMTGPEAGITRDAIAVDWEYDGRPFQLVDTAGLRRKSRIYKKIEKMSVTDTLRAIRLSQVVVLMLDGQNIIEKQDLTIAEHVLREGRILVIAINKWDIVQGKKEMLELLKDRLMRSMGQVPDIPVVTISALKGRNIKGLMDQVFKTYSYWNKRISTGGLNRWVAAMESHHPAPLVQGKPNRLKYIAQIKTRPPTFVIWVSRPKELPQDYKRYIINALRRDFDIQGVPIRLLVRTSKNPYQD